MHNAIPATGEALPVSRRVMLGTTAALAAAVSTGALAASFALTRDPLVDVIEQYRRGVDVYNAIPESDWPQHGGEDAVTASTYGTALATLEGWSAPAITREGAIEAMRFAQAETDFIHCPPTVVAMIGAVLGYLERNDS